MQNWKNTNVINTELDSNLDSESDVELMRKSESDSDSKWNIIAHKWCVIIYLHGYLPIIIYSHG